MNAESNKPIRTFRLRGVKVAVFANKAGEGTLHKVSLQKIYREGDEWKTTQSLGRDDLPVARLLLQRAWESILDLESAPQSGETQNHTAGAVDGKTMAPSRNRGTTATKSGNDSTG